MKKYGLAILLVALAVCVSFGLRPFSVDFPALAPVVFLWAVVMIASAVDFTASMIALIVLSFVQDVFFYAEKTEPFFRGESLVKTLAFAAVGVSLCYLIRSLRDAQASRARLAAIVDSSDDAIYSHDLNGVVTSWNAAAEHMFGYSAREMVGSSIVKIIPPDLHEQEGMLLMNLRAGKRVEHIETERLCKDGSRIKISMTMSPLVTATGRVLGASRIARDITESVRMREAFIESEKLAATGRMAAAIAHEINNPLEAVTNLAFLIDTNPSLDENARTCSKMLLEEINRVSNVAKRSLTFFRDTGKPAIFDVAATVEAVLDLNRPVLAQRGIAVEREFGLGCNVFGSSAEMRQVFSNLIRNAIDAVGDGGEMRVRIRATRSGHWRVVIADNGHGIPTETRRKLFQPFVTTKGNMGNGLGLWISRGIVEKHGGVIRARSVNTPERSWTVFSVDLPAVETVEPAAMTTV